MRPEVTNYMPSVDTGARRRHVTLRSGPEELKGWMESGSIYRVAFFFCDFVFSVTQRSCAH